MENTALITGGSKRIGKEIALLLAKNQYNILLHYNSSESDAIKTKQQIKAINPNIFVDLVKLNLETASEDYITKLYKKLGKKPNVLVNNASLFKYDDIFTINEQSFNKHINTNLKLPIFLAKIFAKELKQQSGNIINIIDQVVNNKSPYYLSYNIAKLGLHNFTSMCAMSLAPNIRVNSISPGHVLKSHFQTDEDFKKLYSKALLKHAVNKREIANAVLFLLNTPSITGQNITIDAGYSINKFSAFLSNKKPF